jgi:hypothetical protein
MCVVGVGCGEESIENFSVQMKSWWYFRKINFEHTQDH